MMKRIVLAVLMGVSLVGGYTLAQDAAWHVNRAWAASAPSDDQARHVAETSLASLKDLGAKIIDFRKLNGESLEREGQKIYIYHYLAAAELPAGVAWVSGGLLSMGRRGFIRDPGQSTVYIETVSLPQGTTAIQQGQITFRLTKRGWLSPDLPDVAEMGYCTQLKPEACYKDRGFDKPR